MRRGDAEDDRHTEVEGIVLAGGPEVVREGERAGVTWRRKGSKYVEERYGQAYVLWWAGARRAMIRRCGRQRGGCGKRNLDSVDGAGDNLTASVSRGIQL